MTIAMSMIKARTRRVAPVLVLPARDSRTIMATGGAITMVLAFSSRFDRPTLRESKTISLTMVQGSTGMSLYQLWRNV